MSKRTIWQRVLRFSGIILLCWVLGAVLPNAVLDQLLAKVAAKSVTIKIWAPAIGVVAAALLYYLFVIWNTAFDLQSITINYFRLTLLLECALLLTMSPAGVSPFHLIPWASVTIGTYYVYEFSKDDTIANVEPFRTLQRSGHLIIPLLLCGYVSHLVPSFGIGVHRLVLRIVTPGLIAKVVLMAGSLTLIAWLLNAAREKIVRAWVWLLYSVAFMMITVISAVSDRNVGWIAVAVVSLLTTIGLLGLTRGKVGAVRPGVAFLADEPVKSLENDRLGRRQLVEELVLAASAAPSPAAFVIGVYGGWGSGKTSLMRMAQEHAKAAGHKTMWLNAWMYDDKAAIWRAFVNGLVKLMREYHLPILPFAPVRKYYKLADVLLKGVAPAGLSLFGISLSSVIEHLPSTQEFDAAKEAVSRQVHALVGEGRRLVVFIDDLDRCSPQGIVGTLEFLKEIGDLNHCVFVLGVDEAAVRAVLEKRYEGKGAEFLHKVIHLTFEMPTVHGPGLYELLSPDLKGSDDDAFAMVNLLGAFFQGNPRTLKRVVNRAAQLQTSVQARMGKVPVQSLLAAELLRATYPKVHGQLQQPAISEQVQDLHYDIVVRQRSAHLGDLTVEEGWRYALTQLLQLASEQAADVAYLLAALLRDLHPQGRGNFWYLFGQTDPPDVVRARRDLAQMQQALEFTKDYHEAVAFVLAGNPQLVPVRVAALVAEKNRRLREGGPLAGMNENGRLRELMLAILNHPDRQRVEAVTSTITPDALRTMLAGEMRYANDGVHIFFENVMSKPIQTTVWYQTFWGKQGPAWPEIPESLLEQWERQRAESAFRLMEGFIISLGRAHLTELLAARPVYQDVVWLRTKLPPEATSELLWELGRSGDPYLLLRNMGRLIERWLEVDPNSGEGPAFWKRMEVEWQRGLPGALRKYAQSLPEDQQREVRYWLVRLKNRLRAGETESQAEE